MRTGTKHIWIGFTVVVTVVAVLNWTRDGDDAEGGISCAIMGFGVLMFLIVGTALERWSDRRKEVPRGFDFLPQQSGPESKDDSGGSG